MNPQNTCPQCGRPVPANAPEGICPKCLLRAGLRDFPHTESRPHGARTEAGTPVVESPVPGAFVPPDIGQLAQLFPQLEILGLLGHGGMGAVYKARQIKLDRLVALKIIRPDAPHHPSFAERFHREAKALARLNHPHIVAVHDFGEVLYATAGQAGSQTLYYFIMEYVDGTNLRQVIAAGTLQPDQALAIVPQICEALQFAHDEDVVHRDIKPENILVDKRGRVKIADFGLAKLVRRTPQQYTITTTNQVVGTPRYMAPEQMEGARQVDHRADIYSLGVVFYEMLTGEVPVGHFEPPSRKVQVDVRLDEVVLRALAREPERRYQHASDVKVDVESISGSVALAGQRRAVAAKPIDGSQRPVRLSRVAVAGAALALIALLTGVSSVYFVLNDPPPLDAPIGMLILTTIATGLCSTLLGAVSIYQIRLANGTLVGFGMACWSLLCAPLALADAAVFGVILALARANGVIPSVSATLVTAGMVCVTSNAWIARRVWLAVTDRSKGIIKRGQD